MGVPTSRATLLSELRDRDIEPDDLMVKLGHPEADPVDVLINAAWELPVVSRAERALRVQREHKEFLENFAPGPGLFSTLCSTSSPSTARRS